MMQKVKTLECVRVLYSQLMLYRIGNTKALSSIHIPQEAFWVVIAVNVDLSQCIVCSGLLSSLLYP